MLCIQHTSVFVTERPVTGQTALCYSMGKWKKYAQGAGRPARSRGGSAGRRAWLRRRGLAVRMETAPGRTNVAKQQISWSPGACGSHGHACSLNVALRALSRQDLCQSSDRLRHHLAPRSACIADLRVWVPAALFLRSSLHLVDVGGGATFRPARARRCPLASLSGSDADAFVI